METIYKKYEKQKLASVLNHSILPCSWTIETGFNAFAHLCLAIRILTCLRLIGFFFVRQRVVGEDCHSANQQQEQPESGGEGAVWR